MGLFSKQTKPEQAGAAAAGATAAAAADKPSDVERPPLKSAASAPAPHSQEPAGNDHQQQHDTTTTSSSEHVHRAKSEPAGGAKKRPAAAPGTAQIDNLTESQRQTLAHVLMISKFMDNAVTVPVINKKIGFDAVIGLIPYAGDMFGATVGTYVITRALKYNMPKRLVLRMMANQAIDTCVGVIPFLGDIFDFGFKANSRNMKLLQDHLDHPKQATRADTCFLFKLFFLLVVVPVMLVVGTIVAIVLGILAAFGKLG